MKVRSLRRCSVQTREFCLRIVRMISAVLYVLAVLIVPGMLSASPADSSGKAAASQRETGPDYATDKLVGTMQSSSLSGAVFENASGEQKFYQKDRAFSDGSRIIAVFDERIIVRTPAGSSLEYLVTRGTPGRAGNNPSSRTVVEPPPNAVPQNQEEGELKRRQRGVRKNGNTAGQDK